VRHVWRAGGGDPLGRGQAQLTATYVWFLAGWAKGLSWTAVAEAFHTTWDQVFRAVARAVGWGLTHRDLAGIMAIGVDKLARRRGHRYVTVVYQLDPGCRRLLWIGRDRKAHTLLGFFRWLGRERTAALQFVCSDMWKPYLRVVAKKAGQALHVLDRFHIMVHMNKAIDKVRAQEAPRAHGPGPGAGPDPHALAAAQAPGSPDRHGVAAADRPRALQPARGAQLPLARAVPVLLDLHVGRLGGEVPGPLVYAGTALADWDDAAGRPDAASPLVPARELFPRQTGAVGPGRRGLQQPRTGSGRIASWTSPSITALAPYQSRKLPTTLFTTL
jgi:hypothetical protein